MPQYRQEIYSGPMLEMIEYPCTPRGRRKSRASPRQPTRKEQAALNEKNSRRKLNRTILANFTEKDIFVTLQYKKPVSDTQAKRDWANFTRRARDALAKRGEELKYIHITEYGAGGGNPHHHAIINYISMDELKKLWEGGDDNRYLGAISTLRIDDSGVEGLSRYLVKETRPKGARRWTPSKNLEKPNTPPPKILKRVSIYRAPPERKGYKMVEYEVTDNEYTGLHRYIRYMRI